MLVILGKAATLHVLPSMAGLAGWDLLAARDRKGHQANDPYSAMHEAWWEVMLDFLEVKVYEQVKIPVAIIPDLLVRRCRERAKEAVSWSSAPTLDVGMWSNVSRKCEKNQLGLIRCLNLGLISGLLT
jgi:hypothetical protein